MTASDWVTIGASVLGSCFGGIFAAIIATCVYRREQHSRDRDRQIEDQADAVRRRNDWRRSVLADALAVVADCRHAGEGPDGIYAPEAVVHTIAARIDTVGSLLEADPDPNGRLMGSRFVEYSGRLLNWYGQGAPDEALFRTARDTAAWMRSNLVEWSTGKVPPGEVFSTDPPDYLSPFG